MSRVILAIATALVAGTVVYNKVAIAHFFQVKDNGIYTSERKWNQSDRDFVNNYFKLMENQEFVDNYQARTGSNVWFMNALNRDGNWQRGGEAEPLDFRSQVEPGNERNERNERNRRERERESTDRMETPRRQQSRINSSRAQETSTIDLDSHTLRQPHYLTVSAEKGTQIIGQITLDGRAIQNIRGNRTAINLSNRLSRGRHLIEVFGNYRPASSSVQVEFSAPDTTVSQTTGGNGVVRQTLILDVR